MPQCSAPNCTNRGAHLFPKDPTRRKRWETALRIKNFRASDSARLCAMHFKEDDYFGKSRYTDNEPVAKFLKKTAVPTIFCFTKIKQVTPEALKRQERYEKISHRKLFKDDKQTEPETSTEAKELGTSTEAIVSHINLGVGREEICTTEDIKVPVQNTYTSPEYLSKSTQVDHEHVYGSINRYKLDDKSILFYTGFETYKKFHFVYSTLSPMAPKIRYFGSNVTSLSTEDQFFLTLMKLRQNKCIFELSRFFNISETTVSNIFITWINFIHQLWSRINIWPSKELIQYYMPQHFKQYDENVRVILDGTEIAVQKPKNPTSQQASWSSYKHANTLKVLVGATPGGLLSYCSQAYAGSISDRQTVERSGLVSKCESGDSVLADRGFTVQDMFADKNITVKIPTFLKGKSQLPGLTIIKDRQLASKRVHIERIIGLTKTYKILKSELDHSYIPIASKIFFVCFMCCNFRECIMKKNK
ncbi:uncharacterized protein LOC134655286 [Cydia amplana]|uniref:uncharacterized protein LOC134655286 n=1 Tax=Cydia amplana TaxID=1869771 RepID=UPI002FE6A60F